jgi:deoxyribose-phosphate aldolase
MDMVREIAKMIDHSLLHPALTDAELKAGCEEAAEYDVACACVKPCDVRQAAAFLEGTDVGVCGVVGFPHGSSTTDVKIMEAERAIADGASEVDVVINIGKALSGDLQYVEGEIRSLTAVAKKHGAIIKIIFENDLLPTDAIKVQLCEICSRCRVDFVKTSTGFNFVKAADGSYFYRGATEADLSLMRRSCPPEVRVKAAGGIRTLDALLRARELGASRIGTRGTRGIVEMAKERFSK